MSRRTRLVRATTTSACRAGAIAVIGLSVIACGLGVRVADPSRTPLRAAEPRWSWVQAQSCVIATLVPIPAADVPDLQAAVVTWVDPAEKGRLPLRGGASNQPEAAFPSVACRYDPSTGALTEVIADPRGSGSAAGNSPTG